MMIEAGKLPIRPTSDEAAVNVDRRSFIRNALLAVGVAGVALPGWDVLYAAAGAEPFYGPDRLAVLDIVAETILPRTDTPGARDVQVPARLDLLMKSWASPKTREDFTRVLDEIEAAARLQDAKGITALSPAKQLEVISAYDQAGMRNPAYMKFKGLVLALYYLSEPGATVELRYEHVPGAWEPSLPVTAETRAWAVDIGL